MLRFITRIFCEKEVEKEEKDDKERGQNEIQPAKLKVSKDFALKLNYNSYTVW